jgi:hypothetical protein
MKEELLKNGYIVFNIDTTNVELNKAYEESIDNNVFNFLKISFNSVSDNRQTPFTNFIENENKKNKILNEDKLEQIWHWKLETKYNEFIYSIFKKFYDYKFDELNIMSSLTLFTKGCFINEHYDGGNSDRVAGILIYLNKNYNEENGGCLVLEDNTKIIPEYGRVVIIDYTQNSVKHLVTPVIENDRKAICAFIHKKI